jgi:hypothetical protein
MRAILLLLVPACSFVFVTGPPSAGPRDAVCTETPIPPIIDAVVAAGAAVGGVAALETKDNCNPNNSDCFSGDAAQGLTRLGGVVLIGTSVVYAIAAIHGFLATSKCRHLHEGA